MTAALDELMVIPKIQREASAWLQGKYTLLQSEKPNRTGGRRYSQFRG
jgi:hypothetical protein